jgi:hypothetical protein
MANETTSTTLAEAMGIRGVVGKSRPIRYNEGLVDILPDIKIVPAGSGPVFDWVRDVAIAVPAGVKTEATGVAPNVAIETLQSRATSGVVGLVIDESFESIRDAEVTVGKAGAAAKAIRKRALADLLAAVTDFTAVSGAAAFAPSMSNLGVAMMAFEATCSPDGAPVGIVLHPACYAILMDEFGVSTAVSVGQSGSAVPSRFTGSISRGTVFGANIFVSDAVAASTTGRSNIIMPMGEDVSPLGLAIWDPVQAIDLGPTDRYTNRTLVVARYGVCCPDPSAGVEWITNDA